MTNQYISSIEKTLKRKLGLLILQKMNDPRAKMVTISAMEVTPDLKEARVGLAVLDKKNEDEEELLEMMQNAAAFLRGEIARTTEIREIPELSFYLDHSIERSIRIEGLIEEAIEEDREFGIVEDPDGLESDVEREQ